MCSNQCLVPVGSRPLSLNFRPRLMPPRDARTAHHIAGAMMRAGCACAEEAELPDQCKRASGLSRPRHMHHPHLKKSTSKRTPRLP